MDGDFKLNKTKPLDRTDVEATKCKEIKFPTCKEEWFER